jgi:hypothetical protein
MPIICVKNWPSACATIESAVDASTLVTAIGRDNERKRQFGLKLRESAINAGVAYLDKIDKVTVSFDAGASQKDDTTIVIIVEGLNTHRFRTKDMLDQLAGNLAHATLLYFLAEAKVEVLVKTFDKNVGGFSSVNMED